VRDLNRIYRDETRAVGSRHRPRGLSMARGRRRRQQHDCLHAYRAEHRPPRHLRLPISHRCCAARYRVGVPAPGFYRELLNTDASAYGGTNVGNMGRRPRPPRFRGTALRIRSQSRCRPLAVIWFSTPLDRSIKIRPSMSPTRVIPLSPGSGWIITWAAASFWSDPAGKAPWRPGEVWANRGFCAAGLILLSQFYRAPRSASRRNLACRL